MNRCWSCEREFGYWEVWRSFWRAGLPRIQCSSCGERSSPAWICVLFSFVIAFLWVVLSLRLLVYLEVPLYSKILLIPIAGFLLSLPLPVAARYGRKPKDVEQ
jgi:CXXC-20-CXXC protein